MPGRLVLCPWLLLAAFPVSAQGDQQLSAIQSSQESIRRETAAIEPLIAELRKLSRSYHDLSKLDEAAKKRRPLRKDIQGRIRRARGLLMEFRELRKEYQFKRGTVIISKFLSGEEEQQVEMDLKEVLELDHFYSDEKQALGNFEKAVRDENNAYNEALNARRSARRRKQFLIVGAAAVGLLLGLVVLAARRRRRAPETVVGVPVETGIRISGPVTPPPGMVHTPMPRLVADQKPSVIPPGSVVGGSYKVVKALGKGSLGQAYEAADLTTQKKVVLKRIREELHRTEKDLDRFLSQARRVAGLKHLNLAEVYSVFLEEERIHLAVEFVSGPPLSRFLEQGNRIAMDSIKRVTRQIAVVLKHAHGSGVVHGDLTPSNVFVTQDGIVKVTDFGIGLEARKTAAKMSWSEPIGSPAYMAPEQELGTILKESDLYSLGVILYEMAAGRVPFEGPNFLAQKREMRYPSPSSLAKGIPAELDALVKKALQPEPQRRYHTTDEFLSALDALPQAAPPAPKDRAA